MRRSTLAAGSALVLLSAGLLASSASASPGSGSVVPSPNPAVKAVLDGPVKAKADGVSLKARGDVKVRDFNLTYGPKSSSGWHAHPGIVIATVQSGTVQRTLPCQAPQTFTAGQAFTEVGPHLVQNLTDSDAVLSITHIYPADAEVLREEIDEPVCRPRS